MTLLYILAGIVFWLGCGLLMCKLDSIYLNRYFNRPCFTWKCVLVDLVLGPIKLVCYFIADLI